MIDTARGKPIVLLAEDSTVQRMAIAALLEKHGYDVLEAGDGAEAVRHLEMTERKPALVLADIGMPRMNGINLCRQVKTNPDTRNIPVIMLTVLDDERNHATAIEAGADEFLAKPVTETALILRVESMLSLTKLRVKQQRDWYRQMFAALPDAVVVTDEQYHWLDANPAVKGLLGYSRKELRELDSSAILIQPAGWMEGQRERLKDTGKWEGRIPMKPRHGSKIEVDARVRSISLERGPVYVWVLRETSRG
jgi:PAS domain S-box-containing protein